LDADNTKLQKNVRTNQRKQVVCFIGYILHKIPVNDEDVAHHIDRTDDSPGTNTEHSPIQAALHQVLQSQDKIS